MNQTFTRRTETLPNSCPDCGAGIVISLKNAYCDANKYASRGGGGDCRWSLPLTDELRQQADEANAAWARSIEKNARQRARGQA